MSSSSEDKCKILNRLKRIEGQVRGIEKMIQSDKDCKDILTQMAAVKSALNKTCALMLKSHALNCVGGFDDDKNKMDELLDTFIKFLK